MGYTDHPNPGSVNPAIEITKPGITSLTFTVESGRNAVGFQVFNGAAQTSYVTVSRCKLELGTISTLANDPPPDPALELLKCQRYFQVFSSESARPADVMDYRPSMRVNPALGTIEISGVTYYTADANL